MLPWSVSTHYNSLPVIVTACTRGWRRPELQWQWEGGDERLTAGHRFTASIFWLARNKIYGKGEGGVPGGRLPDRECTIEHTQRLNLHLNEPSRFRMLQCTILMYIKIVLYSYCHCFNHLLLFLCMLENHFICSKCSKPKLFACAEKDKYEIGPRKIKSISHRE